MASGEDHDNGYSRVRNDDGLRGQGRSPKEKENAPCGASSSIIAAWAYQKNCRRASRMFGLSLRKVRALELYFLLSTIT